MSQVERWGLVVACVLVTAPCGAQVPRAVIVGKEVPPPVRSLPAARLELGWGASSRSGLALRAAAAHPFDEGFSVGGAISHVRFAGSPELRPLRLLMVPLEVHSGFTSDVAFRFGTELGTAASDAFCGGSGVAVGLLAGCRVRTAHRLGLSLRLSAFFKTRGCWEPAPGSRTADTWGQALFELTFDL